MKFRYRLGLVSIASTAGSLLLASCGALNDDNDLTKRAEAALARHDVAEAIPDLNSALQKNPANLAARLALATARIESGDMQSAAEALKQASEAGAPAAQTDPLACRLAQEGGQFAAALTACEPKAGLPETARADMLASQSGAALATGDAARAATLAEAATKLDPNSARSHLALAMSLMQTKDLGAAQPMFDKALALNPNDPRTPIALGQAQANAGNLKGAEQNFRTAVAAARRYQHGIARLVAYTYLVDTLLRQQDTAKAVEAAAELAEWSPNNPIALRTQGRALLAADKAGEARTVLEKAVAAAPGDGPSRLLLSLVHEKLGNAQQAEAQLTSLLAQDPNSSLARRALAEFRIRAGKPAEAMAALGPLLEGPTADSAALQLAGRIGLSTGDVAGSLSILERAVALRPTDSASVLQLAQGYLAAGRVDDAIRVLKTLPGEGSQSMRDAMLALASLQRGSASEALTLASSVARSAQSSGAARNLAVTVLASPSLPPGGEAVLAELAAKDAKDIPSRIALAGLQDARGDLAGAMRQYADALRVDPSNRAALTGYARTAVRSGKGADAVKTLQATTSKSPESADLGMLLADVYVANGDLEPAKTLTADLAKRFPREPGVLLRRGALLVSTNAARQAIPILQKAVELQPKALDARVELARAQLIAQDVNDASLTINRLSTDLGDSPAALAAAARLAMLAKDETAARGYIDRLQELQKDSTLPTVLRAELAASQGDFTAAADGFSRAQKAAPNLDIALREYAASRQAGAPRYGSLERYVAQNNRDARARSVLATIYMENGRVQDARREYEGLLKTDPNDGLALNNLAWIYAEAKDPRAVETAKQAVLRMPGRADVLDTLGFAHLQAGDPSSAVETLVQAVKTGTKDPSIRYRLAVAYEANRQPKDAADALRELLRAPGEFPKRAEAEQMLARLESQGQPK